MSLEEDLLELAKQDPETKSIVKEKLLELQDMNVATRAELATIKTLNEEYIRTAFNIGCDTIYKISIEKKVLAEENEDLKSELSEYTMVDNEKYNKASRERRRKRFQDSEEKRSVIMNEVRQTLQVARQITN